jgi:hypothetical protein
VGEQLDLITEAKCERHCVVGWNRRANRTAKIFYRSRLVANYSIKYLKLSKGIDGANSLAGYQLAER